MLTYMLGDYAKTAAMDTFVASKGDRHSTDMAMLAGCRLVTASETEEGKAWAESRIKSLTGGDPVTARFMRRDFFTYVPQFKLVIVGNHEPELHVVDEAMKRRMNIIPFVFKPEAPDTNLERKLRDEAGQILQWAIDGCIDWQHEGLCRPKAVASATGEYFAEQDLFGTFLAERCERVVGGFEQPARIYNAWQAFAREAGEEPKSMKWMSNALKRNQFQNDKSGGMRMYRNIRLLDNSGAHQSY